MKIGPLGAKLFHEDRQADRQTDRRTDMMELIVFSFFLLFLGRAQKTFLKRRVLVFLSVLYS